MRSISPKSSPPAGRHAPRPPDEVLPAGRSLACDQQTHEKSKRLGINCPTEAASGLIVNNDLRSVSETVYKLMFFF